MQVYTILITGATAGLGRHTALLLAVRGHRVIASGRNETPTAKIETVPLDVTSLSSIAEACTEVDRLTEGRGIDVLINNPAP